jgi:uncharacterized membrane protein
MDAVRLATRGRYYTYRVALVAVSAYLILGGVLSYVLPPTVPLASLLYALLAVAVAASAVGVVCSFLAWLDAAYGLFGSDT